jgi:prepilin-type N-terminal cleavage/methylation domain-containing protein
VKRGGALRRAHTRMRAGADGGLTLMELVVGMSVMSIFMTIFSTGIVQMYRAANKNEATSTAQSQLNLAFLRLDKQIRYAAGVSAPDVYGPDQYVEYLTTNTGTAICTQLRLELATGQLQQRTWTQDATPLAPTGWNVLASGVTSTQPFTFAAADDTYNFQRLQLRLETSSGAGETASSKQTDITFTAMNTSLSTSSDTICTEGRPIP